MVKNKYFPILAGLVSGVMVLFLLSDSFPTTSVTVARIYLGLVALVAGLGFWIGLMMIVGAWPRLLANWVSKLVVVLGMLLTGYVLAIVLFLFAVFGGLDSPM